MLGFDFNLYYNMSVQYILHVHIRKIIIFIVHVDRMVDSYGDDHLLLMIHPSSDARNSTNFPFSFSNR